MKKLLLILLLLPFIVDTAGAQTRQKGKIEAEKIAFFTRRMDLTADEAKEFWPVYNDYLSRRNKLRSDRTSLLKYINQNYKNLEEEELDESGDKIVDYMIEEAKLTKEYHEKFKNILPPYKVIRIYQVETQFNSLLLEQLRNRRSRQESVRRR